MLEEIGIPKNEASVYLVLAKSSGMNASEIAVILNMHRPNIYDILKKLENKGLISSFTLNGKIIYKSRTIDGIKDFWKEKLSIIEQIENELKKYKEEEKECEISVYNGSSILRVLNPDVIKELESVGGCCMVMGLDERQTIELDEFAVKNYFRTMQRKNFKEMDIISEDDLYFPGPEEVVDYKALPKKHFDASIMYVVYGNKLAMVVFSHPAHLIIIKSKKVANGYRKKFMLLWKSAKKVKRK